MLSPTLVQVRADGSRPFTAGLIFVADRCTLAAPILRRWCLGRSRDECRAVFAGHGWKAVVVSEEGVNQCP
jgi:hypothetical protein